MRAASYSANLSGYAQWLACKDAIFLSKLFSFSQNFEYRINCHREAQRPGSAAGRAADRPLQPVVRTQLGVTKDHTSAAMASLRVARLGRNIGQPDYSVVNPVTSYKAKRRSWSGEIWLAVTKDDGVQVDSIFIDQAKFG